MQLFQNETARWPLIINIYNFFENILIEYFHRILSSIKTSPLRITDRSSPAFQIPITFGTCQQQYSNMYHLTCSRDLYQILLDLNL